MESSREAGNAASGARELLDVVDRVAHHLFHGGHGGLEALLANLEHAGLDLVEEDPHIALLVVGAGDILGAGRDDAAEEIFFENDLAVVIGICRRRDKSEQLGDGDRATDLVEHAPVLKRLGECNEIDRLSAISHFDQELENFLVGWEMEMSRLHLGHGVVQRRGGVQN